MKILSEYLNQINADKMLTEAIAENDSLLIEEGFFSKIKSLFHSAKEGVADKLRGNPKSYRSYSTGQYLFAKSKDKDLMEIGKKMNDAAATSVDSYATTLIEVGNTMLKNIKQYEKKLFVTQAYSNVKSQLKLVADSSELSNNYKTQAKELADKLDKAMAETWGDDKVKKAEQENEKVSNQVEQAVKKEESENKEGEGEGEGKEIEGNAAVDKDDKENMGVTDDGKPEATTPEQQKEAIKKEITDNKSFFAPIAKEAKIDGQTLLTTVESFINKTWKYSKQDEQGNPILLWKKEIVGNFDKDIQDVIQNRAVKGIGSIICGLKIIGNDKMSEQVIAKLGDAKNTSGLMNLVKSSE